MKFKTLTMFCIAPLALAAPNPEAHNTGNSYIITPQMFGAIGDGARHPISKTDLDANAGKWVGNYQVGDEWDYAGLQEAIYACFQHGPHPASGSDSKRARSLYLPPGNYLVNKAPTVTELRGATIYGAGRLMTIITSTFAGPAFQTNGCWYTQFTGIQFTGTTPHDGAVFELDGNYDGTNQQGVQANTFKDCLFDGHAVVKYGLALVRRGGNKAQGSENLFLNCHFQSSKMAGVYINGYNAIQNTFLGGNIQSCLNGIYVEAGSINVDSMGFQNGFQSQIEHHGFDIVLRNSADDHSSIKNCRTESACFIDSGNNHYVVLDNNNVVNAAEEWTPGHAYAQGAITRGRTGGNGNGHVHIAMSGGTSGASEPQWPGSGVLATGTIAAGVDTLSVSDPALNKETAKNYGVIVYGAGNDGAPLYSALHKFMGNERWQLADKAVTAASNVPVRIGPLVSDGGTRWMHYEYDEARTNATVAVTNNTFKWGRTRFGGGEIANNSFARADGFVSTVRQLQSGYSQAIVANNHVTPNGGWNTGITLFSGPASGFGAEYPNVFGLVNTALLFMGGAEPGGNIAAKVSSDGDSQFRHIGGGGSPPTVSVAAAAGKGATASLAANSTDLAGQISITTGEDPKTGELASLTFSRAYAAPPFPQISAAGANASRVITAIHVTAAPAAMTLVADTILPASTRLEINYQNLGQ
jgi:hypothetical protein